MTALAEVVLMAEATTDRRCAGMAKRTGQPCNVDPELLHHDDAGVCWCVNHDPDPEVQAAQAAGHSKGGFKKALKDHRNQPRYLDPHDLGDLESPHDAERWAVIIARSVATGKLSAGVASVALRAVAEFKSAYEAVHLEERLRALEATMKRGGLR
jgi:hypothetical protein